MTASSEGAALHFGEKHETAMDQIARPRPTLIVAPFKADLRFKKKLNCNKSRACQPYLIVIFIGHSETVTDDAGYTRMKTNGGIEINNGRIGETRAQLDGRRVQTPARIMVNKEF